MSSGREVITACPNCDNSNITPRHRCETDWRCPECGSEFDDPHERPRRNNSMNAETILERAAGKEVSN